MHVKVEALLLANRAAVDGWLLAVEGGGWENYTPAFFPATVAGYVAGVFALDPSEIGSTPAVVLEINDSAGQLEGLRESIIANGVRPATAAGVPCRVAFAIPFMTVAKGPTVVKVRLSDEHGADLAEITFEVRSPVPDSLPDV